MSFIMGSIHEDNKRRTAGEELDRLIFQDRTMRIYKDTGQFTLDELYSHAKEITTSTDASTTDVASAKELIRLIDGFDPPVS